MRCHYLFLGTLWLVVWSAGASAQSQLSLVEEVDAEAIREQCRQLRAVLKSSLPSEVSGKLGLLVDPNKDAQENVAESLQNVLDPHCLIGITINPESRVKVARGPREAVLVQGKETLILVKVQNDAGVTEGLKISGEQLRTAKETGKGHWLEASVLTEKPLRTKLSGKRLEYVVLRLKAHETGKREATLKFDVGQGTQDLGFRGEVPVLFTVRAARP